MNKLRLFCLLLIMGLCSCSSVSQRQNLAVSRGIYSEHAAMMAGRFDEAQKYDEQLTRLVPPPKKQIQVHQFTTKGKVYAVLPKSFSSTPTTTNGSNLFNTALGNDKTLASNEKVDDKNLDSYTKTTDGVIRDVQKEALKFENEHKSSWFSSIFGWILKLSIPILIIGVICLCIFCPVCIPFVMASIRLILHVAKALLRTIIVKIEDLEVWIESKFPKSPPASSSG